jgi:hypothetical protein
MGGDSDQSQERYASLSWNDGEGIPRVAWKKSISAGWNKEAIPRDALEKHAPVGWNGGLGLLSIFWLVLFHQCCWDPWQTLREDCDQRRVCPISSNWHLPDCH